MSYYALKIEKRTLAVRILNSVSLAVMYRPPPTNCGKCVTVFQTHANRYHHFTTNRISERVEYILFLNSNCIFLRDSEEKFSI